MASLKHALMRIGDVSLQQIVGDEVVKYLDLLREPIAPSKLADVLISRYGPELLTDDHRNIRNILFDALSKDEALDLAQSLGAAMGGDPYVFLNGVRCQYGSPVFDILCAYFSILIPDPVEDHVLEVLPLELIYPKYPVFKYQAQTINRSYEFLASGERRVLIHMPTGSGKTRSAMVLISRILNEFPERPVIVWLAHSEELCDQAAEEFKKAWSVLGTRDVHLARVYSGHEVDLANFQDGLVVAGLSKLYNRSLDEQAAFLQLKRKTGLVVMDEAHQALAPTYNHLLNMLAPKRGKAALLGLSATPGRSWLDMSEDGKLADVFSRQKVTLVTTDGVDPITFLQQEGYLARPDYVWLPYKPSVQLSKKEQEDLAAGLDISPKLLKILGDDVQRNILVLKAVMEQVKQHKKIILFACSVEQAHMLSEVLLARGVRAAAVSSKTSAEQRRQILIDYKETGTIDVLVNYGVLTTGFDAPKTNVVIVARPTQSVVLYSQMIGRAMRGPKSGGNEACTLITVQDAIPGFRTVYEGFTHWEDVWD